MNKIVSIVKKLLLVLLIFFSILLIIFIYDDYYLKTEYRSMNCLSIVQTSLGFYVLILLYIIFSKIHNYLNK